jgi:cytochrome c peroxidase
VYDLKIPVGFPEPIIPEDNSLTEARVELGKRLFYDKSLSINGKIACSSCHIVDYAFADTVALSKGVNQNKTLRNSTQLANVGYQKKLFSEGGVASLELQVLAPSNEESEMNKSLATVAKELCKKIDYIKLFEQAYQSKPNAKYISYAIASFERTLISGNSRFDQYYYQGKETALTDSEINGYKIFSSDSVNCISCHSGFLFSDQKFYNIGLYKTDVDEGRARLTFDREDLGKFKTPSLRNIQLTAPYMHDGSMKTIEEVIEHYILGGKDNPNKFSSIKPVNLSKSKKTDLINFLYSLTDNSFVNDESFKRK